MIFQIQFTWKLLRWIYKLKPMSNVLKTPNQSYGWRPSDNCKMSDILNFIEKHFKFKFSIPIICCHIQERERERE